MNASPLRNPEYGFLMSKIKGLEGKLAARDTKGLVWFLSGACVALLFFGSLFYFLALPIYEVAITRNLELTRMLAEKRAPSTPRPKLVIELFGQARSPGHFDEFTLLTLRAGLPDEPPSWPQFTAPTMILCGCYQCCCARPSFLPIRRTPASFAWSQITP